MPTSAAWLTRRAETAPEIFTFLTNLPHQRLAPQCYSKGKNIGAAAYGK
jgi:hypothetical protein